MTTRKVLHISTNYKPLGENIGHGGVERLVFWLAQAQKAKGYAVEAVGMPGGEFEKTYTLFPANIGEIKANDRPRYDAICEEISEQIVQMATANGYDLIHDHMGMFSNSKAALEQNTCPVILSIYGQLGNIHYDDIYRSIPHIKSRVAKFAVTTASVAHKNHFLSVFSADHVMLNGIPQSRLVPADNPFCVLSWATICDQKQQVFMCNYAHNKRKKLIFAGPYMRAIAEDKIACDEFEKIVQVTISAKDMNLADLKKAVEEFEASTSAYSLYVGEVYSQEQREYLYSRATYLALLNSTDEPLSLICLEAMSQGLPCLTGPYASALESVPDHTYIMSALTDDEMQRVLALPLQSREEIQAYCRKKFAIERWVSQYEDVYDAFVGRTA